YLPLIRAVAASVGVPTVTTEPDRPTSTSTPTTTTQPDRPTATSTSSPTATTQPEQPTATPTATTELAPPDDLRFFVDSRWRTSSAAIAVDEQGGKHLAFHYYEPVSE